jgi:hypothetical protein
VEERSGMGMESWDGETADSVQHVDAYTFESSKRIPQLGIDVVPFSDHLQLILLFAVTLRSSLIKHFQGATVPLLKIKSRFLRARRELNTVETQKWNIDGKVSSYQYKPIPFHTDKTPAIHPDRS